MRLLSNILQLPFPRRQKKAMETRSGIKREDFTNQLAQTDLEYKAASWLWDHLRKEATVDDFRPMPDDDLEYLYGIAEEELDIDLLSNLAHKLDLRLPTSDEVASYGPVRRPRDVINLFFRGSTSSRIRAQTDN
jgi:hypothetical protein